LVRILSVLHAGQMFEAKETCLARTFPHVLLHACNISIVSSSIVNNTILSRCIPERAVRWFSHFKTLLLELWLWHSAKETLLLSSALIFTFQDIVTWTLALTVSKGDIVVATWGFESQQRKGATIGLEFLHQFHEVYCKLIKSRFLISYSLCSFLVFRSSFPSCKYRNVK